MRRDRLVSTRKVCQWATAITACSRSIVAVVRVSWNRSDIKPTAIRRGCRRNRGQVNKSPRTRISPVQTGPARSILVSLAYRVAVAPPMWASRAATRIAQQLSHPGLEMEQPAVGFQLVSYQSSRVGRYRPMPAVFEDPAVRLRQMSVPRRALTSRPIPATLECVPLTNNRDRSRPNLPRMSPKRRAKGVLNMLLSVEMQLLYNKVNLCLYFMVNYRVVDGLSSGSVAAPCTGSAFINRDGEQASWTGCGRPAHSAREHIL